LSGSHLDSAHKSGDTWVCIASSVQAWVVVHWEDPQRLEPIRIPARLIPINAPPAEDCTLEVMRTQASAFHDLLIFNFRMRERKVLGWRPRRLAAPPVPSIRQLEASSTRVM